jgi:parallel beta-helix repeat protein
MVRAALLIAVAALALGAWSPWASAATLQCGDTVKQNTVLDSDIVCTNPDDIGLVIGADNITLQLAHHTIQGPGLATPGGSIGITDDGLTHTNVAIRGGTVTGFDTGIYVQASNSAVKGMTLTSFNNGIFFVGDDNYMFHNSMSSAATLAMDIEGRNNYLWGNLVQGKPDDAISVIGENPLVVLNQVDSCTFNGISVAGYTAAKIARNKVSQCDSGIVISGANGKLQTNSVSGNTDGLFVLDPSSLVRFNSADGNSSTGISVGIAGSTLFQNTANNNGGYGIDAVIGTIDGGGNLASGNVTGNCLGIVCGP